MTARKLPGLGIYGYDTPGASGWQAWMDASLRMISVFAQLAVTSRTAALPAAASEGTIYIAPPGHSSAGRVAVYDNSAWVFLIPPRDIRAYVSDEGSYVRYDADTALWVEEIARVRNEVKTITSATYTLTADDFSGGSVIIVDRSEPTTILVPSMAGQFPAGELPRPLVIVRYGAGTVSVAPNGSASLLPDEALTAIPSKGGVMTILPISDTKFVAMTDKTGESAAYRLRTATGDLVVLSTADFDGTSVVTLDSAVPVTLVVPAGVAGAKPVSFVQMGAGRVTVSPAFGVTVNATAGQLRTRTQFSAATLLPTGADSYVLAGDLAT